MAQYNTREHLNSLEFALFESLWPYLDFFSSGVHVIGELIKEDS
jgi:hypothetical protein